MIRTINCIFSLKDKIRELAESIFSEETEELHYLPPLKLLNLVGQNLKREKSPAVMINKTSQSEEKADLNLVNFSLSVPKMSLLNMCHCRACKDKQTNGGKGTLKKACQQTTCVNLKSRKRILSSKLEQNVFAKY